MCGSGIVNVHLTHTSQPASWSAVELCCLGLAVRWVRCEAGGLLEQVETTISRGRIVFQHGQVLAEPGSSRFVELPPFAPAAFEGLDKRQASWIQEEFPYRLYGQTPVKRTTAQKLSGRDEL